jgi:hypothetical protein
LEQVGTQALDGTGSDTLPTINNLAGTVAAWGDLSALPAKPTGREIAA